LVAVERQANPKFSASLR